MFDYVLNGRAGGCFLDRKLKSQYGRIGLGFLEKPQAAVHICFDLQGLFLLIGIDSKLKGFRLTHYSGTNSRPTTLSTTCITRGVKLNRLEDTLTT